jgi:hypothetical protein
MGHGRGVECLLKGAWLTLGAGLGVGAVGAEGIGGETVVGAIVEGIVEAIMNAIVAAVMGIGAKPILLLLAVVVVLLLALLTTIAHGKISPVENSVRRGRVGAECGEDSTSPRKRTRVEVGHTDFLTASIFVGRGGDCAAIRSHISEARCGAPRSIVMRGEAVGRPERRG